VLDEILKKIEPEMEKVLSALWEEFKTLHTGKASAALVENLQIDYYGTKVSLKQMAQITISGANQIVIIPFDPNASRDIETSIRNSDLNLNPQSSGKQIRLILPPLTEERRKELTKVIRNKAEVARVAVRNIRRAAWDEIQKSEKSSQITKDDKYHGQEELNKIVENYNLQIDEMVTKKEKELMTV